VSLLNMNNGTTRSKPVPLFRHHQVIIECEHYQIKSDLSSLICTRNFNKIAEAMKLKHAY